MKNNINIIYSFEIFFFFFYWSPSDINPLQVSRILLGLLADFSYTLVWMVSTSLVISKSISLWTSSLVIVPSEPATIVNAVTFVFHSLF